MKEQTSKLAKLMAILLAMVLALSACGKGQEEPKKEADESQAVSQAENKEDTSSGDESSKEASTENLVEDGVLDVGTNATFPPFEYYDGDQMVGIDIDLITALADKMGLKVKVHDMEFEAIIASIESGKVDCGIAGMSVSPDREKSVNFTQNYFTSKQMVLIMADSPYSKVDDLKGKKLGAQMGTTSQAQAAELFGEENIQAFSTYQDACLAMQNEKLDAVVCDEKTAENFAKANPDMKIMEENLAEESYAIALSKKNEPLAKAMDQALQELSESGDLQKIIDKYIQE